MKRGNNNLFNSFHNGNRPKSPRSSGGSSSGNSRATIPTQSAATSSLTKSMFRSVPMVDVSQPSLSGGMISPPSLLGMGASDPFGAAPTIPTLDSKSLFSSKMMPSLSVSPPGVPPMPMKSIPSATPISKPTPSSVGGSKMDMEAMASAAASSAPTWNVDRVPDVPLFHKVAWNALHVSTDDIKVNTIVERIAMYLRLHSIAVSFNDEQAKATCTTNAPSLVKFVIRLWQPTTQGTTIVEVQRVQGDSLELQKIKSGLEDAIQCQEEQDIQPPSVPSFETIQAQHELFQCVLPPPPVSLSAGTQEDEKIPGSLEICIDLFRRGRVHEHKLGLETLCHLTDPQHTFLREVTVVSSFVLQDEDFQEHLQEHLQPVGMSPASLLAPHGFHPVTAITKPSGPIARAQDFHGASMHLLALQSLGNALEAVTKDEESRPSLNLSSVFWQTTLASLRYNLGQANQHLLEAALSVRCLRHLQALEPSCMGFMDSSGDDMIVDSLRMAYHHGCCASHSLEHESRCCLEGLGIQV